MDGIYLAICQIGNIDSFTGSNAQQIIGGNAKILRNSDKNIIGRVTHAVFVLANNRLGETDFSPQFLLRKIAAFA